MAEMTFYMDETGNRHPDKKPDGMRKHDWFGFGGYLINREDEDAALQLYDQFVSKWNINNPLHYTDMQAERGAFKWLERLPATQRELFWQEFRTFMANVPAVGLACIIHRPGYVARGHLQTYGDKRWLLCRSAFDISIERAVKYAISQGRRLRVIFESDLSLNHVVEGYFHSLKINGLEFDEGRSSKYSPLSKEDFSKTLTTIKNKPKSSRMVQIADSYIYAMSRAAYEKKFELWRRLRDNQRIMDFALGGNPESIRAMGVKHYCFDKN